MVGTKEMAGDMEYLTRSLEHDRKFGYWLPSDESMITIARILNTYGYWNGVDNVIDFFEKPSKFDKAIAEFVANLKEEAPKLILGE